MEDKAFVELFSRLEYAITSKLRSNSDNFAETMASSQKAFAGVMDELSASINQLKTEIYEGQDQQKKLAQQRTGETSEITGLIRNLISEVRELREEVRELRSESKKSDSEKKAESAKTNPSNQLLLKENSVQTQQKLSRSDIIELLAVSDYRVIDEKENAAVMGPSMFCEETIKMWQKCAQKFRAGSKGCAICASKIKPYKELLVVYDPEIFSIIKEYDDARRKRKDRGIGIPFVDEVLDVREQTIIAAENRAYELQKRKNPSVKR